MLEYLKGRLAEMAGQNTNKVEGGAVPNETIMECAHLIQELSDLSVEGEDERDAINNIGAYERPLAGALDIPLEDDIEIGSIELNLLDGRTTDTAGDAAVPTVNEYATNLGLKTEEEFYQEAKMMVHPLVRESQESLNQRINEYAHRKMEEYHEQCIQEGVFGHDKLKISDTSVPGTVTVNFGPLKGAGSPDYYVKLPIKYQVDKQHRVLRKQVEAIAVLNEIDAFKGIKKKIHEVASGSSSYDLKSEDELWEHATPVELRVPTDPADKYVIFVAIDADWEDKELVFMCTISMKGAGKKTGEIKSATNIGKKAYKSKKELIKESADILAEERRNRVMPSRFGNIFQESIDLGSSGGDTDLPPASGSATDVNVGGDPAPAAPAQDTANTEVPTVDAGGGDNPPATNEASSDTSGADVGSTDNSATSNPVEVPVQTNDVSDQIADKVASETQDVTSDNAINNDLNNIDDNVTFDDNGNDFGFDDNSSSELGTDMDTSLDDGGSDGSVDLPGDADGSDGSMDMAQFENMSIDDLMQQGSEKLKSLSIGQLKSFLSGENTDPVVEEAFQEAFFLTPRNINKEVYKELKRSLGILNMSNESGVQILGKFKAQSKGLNRVLVKASKMEKVYNPDQRRSFSKLNKCLMDLNIVIGSSNDANYAATIKRLIQAFISQAQAVRQIIFEKDPSLKQLDVQKKGTTDVNTTLKNGPKGVLKK